MKFDKAKIEEKIIDYCTNELEFEIEKSADISFHMTDWLEDLEELVEFYQDPSKFSSEELDDVLFGFLVHVPNHIAAAAKLLTEFGVSDIFNIGAVDKGEDYQVK